MKVLICDDQALIRDSLELLLKLEKDLEVVGHCLLYTSPSPRD